MQQNQSQNSKGTIIILIVILLVSIGLFFYFKGKPSDSSISSLEESGTAESNDALAASNRVVSLLNQISSLEINDSIFKTPVYKSLVDYTVAIPEQNIGRPNPFAPIGGGSR